MWPLLLGSEEGNQRQRVDYVMVARKTSRFISITPASSLWPFTLGVRGSINKHFFLKDTTLFIFLMRHLFFFFKLCDIVLAKGVCIKYMNKAQREKQLHNLALFSGFFQIDLAWLFFTYSKPDKVRWNTTRSLFKPYAMDTDFIM